MGVGFGLQLRLILLFRLRTEGNKTSRLFLWLQEQFHFAVRDADRRQQVKQVLARGVGTSVYCKSIVLQFGSWTEGNKSIGLWLWLQLQVNFGAWVMDRREQVKRVVIWFTATSSF